MNNFKLTPDMRSFFPLKSFYWIIGVWLVLAALNFWSLEHWKFTGADLFFPFSVLYPSNFLLSGFLFAGVFLLMGYYFWQRQEGFSITQVLFISVLLVIFGNMAQGNLDIAMEQPFYLKGRQYYHDAVHVLHPAQFLETFNANQDQFQMHTRTHPPFVVLLHWVFLKISGGSILFLSVAFFLISALFFPVLHQILKNFGFSARRRRKVLLLAAVIPSVNIYLLVSLDGIILMTVSLLLWAISRIYRDGRTDAKSVLLMVSSVILTNMLSFSGLFLLAFLGLYSLFFMAKRQFGFVWITAALTGIMILFFTIIYWVSGYHQLDAFLHASASENPKGFMLLHQPYIYFWTRLQAAGEIMMFLSLGFCAVLLGGHKYSVQLFADAAINRVFIAGVSALLLMFLTGAYGTGETARACLFIVPFFLLLLKNLRNETIFIVYFLSLFQTFGMQTIGNFFW
ncbi:hypothetical protein [Chryseobacterium sp. MFBS3-17]|uniref:hypothetical protein n=1 Tax=Chryseobacterium sp. MFBS3-17 TaxID=2886689 RepID=UPI001D0DEDBB|nr:hypothetical protein [Chryseobacterium sp. MFBS3-17]MCC2591335.1 hypothetical protein [Chryseobacterium sp. MFBS3-17]